MQIVVVVEVLLHPGVNVKPTMEERECKEYFMQLSNIISLMYQCHDLSILQY